MERLHNVHKNNSLVQRLMLYKYGDYLCRHVYILPSNVEQGMERMRQTARVEKQQPKKRESKERTNDTTTFISFVAQHNLFPSCI